MSLTVQDKENMLKVVTAMFNLAPDSAIYNSLASSYEAYQGNLYAFASDLAKTNAFQNKIAGLDNAGKIDYIMDNFGFVEGTVAGNAAKAYYAHRLDDGATIDQLITETIKYLDDDNRRKAVFDTSKQTIDNKTEVAEKFAESGVKASHLSQLDVVSAVTDNPLTKDIVTNIITMLSSDKTALDDALNAISEVKVLTNTILDPNTLDTTLTNLKTIVENVATKVLSDKVDDTTSALNATAKVIAATAANPAYIENPDTIANNIVTDPMQIINDATSAIEGENGMGGSGSASNSDNTPPTAILSYSKDGGHTWDTTADVKQGDSLIIKATFSEAIDDSSAPMIAINNNILSAANMTKDNSTVYTYTLSVPSGDIANAIVTVSNAKDLAGNVIVDTIPAHHEFTIDNTAPIITVAPAISTVTSIGLTSNENVVAGIYDSTPALISQTATLSANTSGNIPITPQNSVKTGHIVVVDGAGNQTADSSVTVVLGTSGDDGTINGTSGDDMIFGFGGNDIIDAKDGNDKVIGGAGNDTITSSSGNNIILGGEGVDTISGGTGDDTFVVLGTIANGDYSADDVAVGTGAYKLGLRDTIVAGISTSNTGTDGSGETYDGGAGTNVIEVWGNANLRSATISNINSFNVHSTLDISDTQLATLGANGAVDLDMLDEDSVINIIGSQNDNNGLQEIDSILGIQFLTYFTPQMGGLTAQNINTFDAVINFNMDPTQRGIATSYIIGAEDVVPALDANGNGSYTDDGGENSVVFVADPALTGITGTTTVSAGDGDDIVFVSKMSSSIHIDGGDNSPASSNIADILVFDDSANGVDETDDLDNVTNVEIVSLIGGNANIVAKDSLVAAGDRVTIDASDLFMGSSFTFNGSAESDGYYTISGSESADTITGGALSDIIIADDTDTIDGGSDGYNGTTDLGDKVIFKQAVSAANLTDAHLTNIESVVVTDYDVDASEVYDFSAQSENLLIQVDNSVAFTGVTVTGGAGNDVITLGTGPDIVNVNAGIDTIIALSAVDSLNVSAGATADLSSDNGDTLDMTSLAGYSNNGIIALDNSSGTVTTIIGAGGIENITASANGDTISGGAGNDIVTLGAGVDTVIRNGDGTTDGTDIINNFTAGTGGDIIDFTNNAAVDSTGPTTLTQYEEIDSSSTAVSNDTGLVVVTNSISDSDNSGAIELDEILASDAGNTFDTAGDKLYAVYTDGTDSYLILATEVGSDGVSDTDTINVIAKIAGVTDPSTFDAANFADFS